MGRHNHENSVALPGYGNPVVLSGDDTFTSGPLTGVFPAGGRPRPVAALLLHRPGHGVAAGRQGRPLGVRLRHAGRQELLRRRSRAPGRRSRATSSRCPKDIATGRNADGSELKAADKGYPPPPNNGSWQTDLRSATPVGIDGPQWVLEYWSDINNVFQFVRVEDIAYDKRPGMGNVVYVVDSGRGRTAAQSLDTPNFRSTNGRVWKMVLDRNDPTVVTSLTVFVEGDDNPGQDADRGPPARQHRDDARPAFC